MNKKMNYLKSIFQQLKAWFGQTIFVNTSRKTEKHNKENRSKRTQELLAFLAGKYDFRYNSLNGNTEFRPKDAVGTPFRPIDQREMNGLIVEARLNNIEFWTYDLPTVVLSTRVESFHPFKLYMDELPQWDGTDRITPLARLVSTTSVWTNGFHRWMLGMVSQWMGKESAHANALAPILISTEQGYNKSTFCKILLPDHLQDYYLDKLNLTTQSMPEKRLGTLGLINLDEFDRISESKMPELKNLMQMTSVHCYQGKMKGWCNTPRLASFIGTTNKKQILTDPTGSRRFLCVELKNSIPEVTIEHKQLYAQLKHELEQGERSWLNKEEERELQCHNREFYIQSPLEEAFYSCFRTPQAGEPGEWLTAVELFTRMQHRFKAALRDSSPRKLSTKLVGIGWTPHHSRNGNRYHVTELKG